MPGPTGQQPQSFLRESGGGATKKVTGVNDSGLRNTVAVPGAPGQRPLPHWTSAGWQSAQIPCVERPCCMAACALPREVQPGGAGSAFGPRMLAESCPIESILRTVQSHHLPGRVEQFPKVSRECRASPNRHRKPQKMVPKKLVKSARKNLSSVPASGRLAPWHPSSSSHLFDSRNHSTGVPV